MLLRNCNIHLLCYKPKSWDACNQEGICFIPIALESLGAWHMSAVAPVKKLGSAKARHIGEERLLEIARLFQKLSIALMRGNAALLNNRVPAQQGDEEYG